MTGGKIEQEAGRVNVDTAARVEAVEDDDEAFKGSKETSSEFMKLDLANRL